MKKHLVFMLVLVMCVVPFAIVGCGHKHSYGEWQITQGATCEADGVKTQTCECGDVKTQSINKTGHNFVDGICSSCGTEE